MCAAQALLEPVNIAPTRSCCARGAKDCTTTGRLRPYGRGGAWSSVCGGARRRICMLTRAHRPGLGSARDPFQGCTTSRLMSSKTVPVNFVYAGGIPVSCRFSVVTSYNDIFVNSVSPGCTVFLLSSGLPGPKRCEYWRSIDFQDVSAWRREK